jgi:RND family efflux transporter MFP subunit
MKNWSFLLMPLLLGPLLSCSGGRSVEPAAELPPVPVHTVVVEKAAWPALYEATGTVRARTVAAISSKVMGYVRQVKVSPGDAVRAGQLLIALDARDLEAAQRRAEAALAEAKSAVVEVDGAIAAAKAQLELAQATFRRMQELHGKKSVSDQEFDEAAAKVRLAEANHQMALARRRQLDEKIEQAAEAVQSAAIMRSYADIVAPFDGVVTEKMAEPGNLAAPGVPLLTVERAGAYRLEARLEESLLGVVRNGHEVEVELEALGKTFPARVSEVVPAVDAASRAFLVKIDLPAAPGLRSGLFGRARFRIETREVLAIPAAAVVERGQVRSVFAVEQGRARSRLVALGERRGDRVEVLSGLAAGETIASAAPPALVDGRKVEVMR